jgi:ADP-ribosyl-[dinitrogen reductase] hydrolase
MTPITSDSIKAALFGLCIGDALGVPVEFSFRSERSRQPITDMTGYGTYNQAPGTWSDDSSLTFCLAEALCQEFDLNGVARYFLDWYQNDYWTAHDDRFDIGNTTRDALDRILSGVSPFESGGAYKHDNGNGSLMRILPLVFKTYNLPIQERYADARDVSGITHRHTLSVVSCFYYLEFARLLLQGSDILHAYQSLCQTIPEILKEILEPDGIPPEFKRMTDGSLLHAPIESIESHGFVIHTLEASIWCLLQSTSYSETVLRAVNLGGDTDTTAAVAGGLAGLVYGMEGIPEKWIRCIARREDIEELARRMGYYLLPRSCDY